MPQLKPSFVKDIRSALENSRFTLEDFSLELPESGSLLAKITFVHQPEYALTLLEEHKQEHVVTEQKYMMSTRTEKVSQVIVSVTAIPGEFKTRENTEIYEFGELLRLIPKWCENIRADLYALVPVKDPLEAFRIQLQAKLDQLVDEPASFFNEEELATVDKRFDQLYEEITQLREQYSLTKQQLEAIEKEIEEFKKSARSYPKGIWAKVTGNKIIKATGQLINSPEGRTLLFQSIRHALGLPEEP